MVPILFVDDGGLFLLSRFVFNSQYKSLLETVAVKLITRGTETAASTKTTTACVVSQRVAIHPTWSLDRALRMGQVSPTTSTECTVCAFLSFTVFLL